MGTAVVPLPEAMEEWTQEQRDSLVAIAKRTLSGHSRHRFSGEFIARHVDDFVQDALLQAWVSQREARRVYNPAGFVSFKVVQLALDKAKGERRRLERTVSEGSDADGGEPTQTAAERVSDPVRIDEAHEIAERLHTTKLAMAELPERQRLAFVKCQLEGRSQSAVAKELSEDGGQPVSRKAVERLVANARANLSASFARLASGVSR